MTVNDSEIDKVKKRINSFLASNPKIGGPITSIAEKVKVDKAFIVIGVAALIILLAVAVGFGDFIIDLVGYIYPVYASIKAIETEEKDDDTQWLTYWLIFSSFKIFEGIAYPLIVFIPFYHLFKVAFLIYAYYPTTKGATVVYNSFFKPYVVPLVFGQTSTDGESDKDK